MFKKITATVLCAVLLLSASGNVLAAQKQAIINETFDNYALNELPQAVTLKCGVDSRTVQRSAADKAFYSKAWGGSAAAFDFEAQTDSTSVCVEAEVMLAKGRTDGAMLSVTDIAGNTFDFIKYKASGEVELGDGKLLTGYTLDTWKKYAVAINLDMAVLDLFIDGKQVLDDWKFSFGKLSAPSSLGFYINAPESGEPSELFVDNVRMYEGKYPLSSSAFESRGTNTQVMDFVATAQKPSDGELFVDFECDSKSGLNIINTENTLEFVPDSDDSDNNVMHIARKSGSASDYAEIAIPSEAQNAATYMTEINVKIVNNVSSVSLMWLKDVGGKWLTSVSLSGNVFMFHGQRVYTLKTNEWTKINVAYNNITRTFAAYVNGVQVGKTQTLPNGALNPAAIRVGFGAGEGTGDIFFDKLKLYGGTKIIEFEKTAQEEKKFSFNSILEKPSDAKALIGSAAVFMTKTDSVFFGGEKRRYSELGAAPRTTDGVFEVPATLIEKVFGKKPDTEYVALEDYCKDVLSMYVRYYNIGIYLVSSTPISYTDSVFINDIHEPIDIIYRYMQFERRSGEEIYSLLNEYSANHKHPRLITEPTEIEKIKGYINQEPLRNAWLSDVLKTANNYLTRPCVEVTETGTAKSLLQSARSVLLTVRSLGTAYQITGDEMYARRCLLEMENIMSWEDWNGNSTNYLDTSETSYAMAIGYDMLYDWLTQEAKDRIIDSIFEKSLDWATNAYSGTHRRIDWVTSESPGNWSAVCNGGVISSCLAIIDDLSGERLERAKWLLSCATQSIEYMTMLFFPDGAWIEGPAYWGYAMDYLFGAIYAPLRYSCGTTLDLLEPEGIKQTLSYILYLQSPSGHSFNYGDGTDSPAKDSIGYLLALLSGESNEMAKWKGILDEFKVTGDDRSLLWYREGDASSSNTERETDKYFISAGAGAMRQSWGNRDATFAGVKMGLSHLAHGNLDLGNFVFDTLGERWAMELGPDNYSLSTGYWGAAHWRIYKARPEGQNVIVINPRADIEGEYYGGQYLDAYAPLIRQESGKRAAIMVADLSDAYKYDTSQYKRGFMLADERQSLVVQDEFTLLEDNSTMLWFMHTPAQINIDPDGKGATLTQNGKSVRVEADSNAASFYFEDREIKPLPTSLEIPDQLQDSYKPEARKLTMVLQGSGDIHITVKLSPVLEYESFDAPSYIPIDEWKIPQGDIPEKLRATAIYADGVLLDGFDTDKTTYEVPVVYGSEIPKITAENKLGILNITQSESVTQPSLVTVSEGAKTITYTINYVPKASVTDDLIQGMSPTVGIAQGMRIQNGISASASIVQETQNGTENVFDGDFTTRWAAAGYDQWVEIDLGDVYDIDGIALGVYEGKSRQNIFSLMLSENKMNYTSVFDARSTGQTDGYESYVFDKPRRARYIRYLGNQCNTSKWNSVTELAALIREGK